MRFELKVDNLSNWGQTIYKNMRLLPPDGNLCTLRALRPRPFIRGWCRGTIGWIDVADRPYAELVSAAQATHARSLDLHLGKTRPVERKARSSEVGTPADAMGLGRSAIQ